MKTAYLWKIVLQWIKTPLNLQAVRRIMPELKVRDFVLLLYLFCVLCLMYCHGLRVCDYRRRMDWWMDLLITCIRHSELQAITAPPLISTIYKPPQHLLSLFQPAVSSSAVPWQRHLTVEILQLHVHRSSCHSRPCRAQLSQSQSYFTTCALPPISSSWCQAPWDSRPEIFISTKPLRK
jgi:hypothetical protein